MLNAYLLHYFPSNPQVFSHKNTMLAGCIPQLLVKSYPIKRFMILKLYSNPFNDRYNPHFWLLSSGSLFWFPIKQVVWPFILTHESSMAVKSLILDYVIISYPINHHFPLWNPTLMVHLGVQGTILHGHWVTLDCNISRTRTCTAVWKYRGWPQGAPFSAIRVHKYIGDHMVDTYTLHTNIYWLVVFRQPLWKMMEWKPVGMMTFPTEWKNNPTVPNHQSVSI